MVQCSPLREATLSAYRATARFGAYHRAAYGGYYATKRYAQRAAYLSPERLRPFRSGSMFSQASKALRCKALDAVRLLYHKSKQTTFAGGMTVPRPAAAGSFDGTMFSVTESDAFR